MNELERYNKLMGDIVALEASISGLSEAAQDAAWELASSLRAEAKELEEALKEKEL